MKATYSLGGLLDIASQVVSGAVICLHVNVSTHLKHFSKTKLITICSAVKCDQPEDPKNGRAFYTAYTFGSTVSYQCKAGYRLYGPSNRTCQADRMWSDDTPQCNSMFCFIGSSPFY